jgi:hypothetical protein
MVNLQTVPASRPCPLAEKAFSPSGFVWAKSSGFRPEDCRKLARRASFESLVWNWKRLGISARGREAAESLEFAPSEVFAHPDVMSAHPELAEYYRLMAFLPKKGLPKIKSRAGTQDTLPFCRFLNRRLSSLISVAAKVSRENRLNPIFVGAAKQQGNWPDPGLEAARDLEQIITNYATENGLVDFEATERLNQSFDLLPFLKMKGNGLHF